MPIRSLTAYAQTTNTFESKPLGYLEIYERYFASMMDRDLKLLELGVAGGQSMKMWESYFLNGQIVGIDLFPKFEPGPDESRIKIFSGSQSDKAFLSRVAQECAPGGFDIIIDDCSHIGELTKISFWHLFTNHLKPGGVYAIEDWGTGYWGGYETNVCYPDSKYFDNRDKETFLHWLANRYLKSVPVEWQETGPWQKILKRFQYTRRFNTHNYGMVGFVKQLIDELAISEITGPNGTPRFSGPREQRWSQFAHILYSPGIVLVTKL